VTTSLTETFSLNVEKKVTSTTKIEHPACTKGSVTHWSSNEILQFAGIILVVKSNNEDLHSGDIIGQAKFKFNLVINGRLEHWSICDKLCDPDKETE